MSLFDVMNKLFDLAEKLKQPVADVQVIIGDVGKLIEDVQAVIPMAEEPHTVGGGPRPHRLLKAFVRNRVIAGAARRSGKSWDEVAAVYDAKVTPVAMMGAFAEVGVEAPLVGGSFSDWLKNVDWAKLFDVIMKLIALIAPFLA